MADRGSAGPDEAPVLEELQVRGRPVRTWAIGAGAVLLAISSVFGGLEKADEEMPQVATGEAVDAGQFEVTVDRVVAVKDLEPLFTPDRGGALLGVVTKLKLTDKTGTTPPNDLIRLVGVPGVEPDQAPLGTTNLRDQTRTPVLTPDHAEDVAYVFKLPKATELPKEVKLTIQHYTFGESVLDHHDKWTPDEIAAEVTATVKDNTR